MKQSTRRDFFKLAGTGVLSASLLSSISPDDLSAMPEKKSGQPLLNLGMASYTFRKFSMDKTVEMTKRLGLKHIAFKSMHLPLESTADEVRAVAAKVKEAGLDLYGCGVVYMKDEASVQQAFDYAKAAGMKVIIGVPNHELLELVELKVKQFDIQVAIHNHGPGDKLYPTPESIYEKIKKLDSRIGLCVDIGHTQRVAIDPSEAVKKYQDRLLDVHVKDVSASSPEGKTVEIGRGVIDIPKFLKTLIKLKYTGKVSLEYEKDEADPLPGAAESIGYLRGVLALL
ncbi:sugar phosphate isomerase/epimerase [candidate division KSB1 bacterium]|nr:sugar phosphate isomerase/epimerase [candidate division KSB1 bacterium]